MTALPQHILDALTESELEMLDVADLDKAAFGMQSGDTVTLAPQQIRTRYAADREDAEAEFARRGLVWARRVSLRTPVNVSFDGKDFWLEDGHHRWLAASKTGRTLRAVVDIKANPITAILQRRGT